ncbi:MAG TPA: hypothetical protein VHD33_02020 [Legionellaceae bacterium]|nr:hypothetical protein [Legionellaceae bacterium]
MNIPDVSGLDLDTAAVQIALSQEGVHEVGGNNMGPEVKIYLASVGLDEGYAWCCGFGAWCIKEAAKQLGIIPQIKMHASVYAIWHDPANKSLILPEFQPNCLVLKNEGLNKQGHPQGHLMFGISKSNDNILHVVSGNTNAAGSHEGNCVAVQDRSTDELKLGYGYMAIR